MRYLMLFASLLCACQTDPKDSEVTLRAYDVPEAQAAEIAGLLRILMDTKKGEAAPRIGYAMVSPNGRQVLVTAPKSFHNGVSNWIDHVKQAPDKAATPPSVRLEYWVVQARPAPERKDEKSLTPITPALDALVKEYGPQALTLSDRVSVLGRSGEKVKNASTHIEVEHLAIVRGDVVDADIDISTTRSAQIMRARLNVPIGKLVVIGDAQTADNATLYYVVRATVL